MALGNRRRERQLEAFDNALDYSRRLIDWYNNHYGNRNLELLTPAAVHNYAARRILDKHRVVLGIACASYVLHQE
jgi:hypothetical protein